MLRYYMLSGLMTSNNHTYHGLIRKRGHLAGDIVKKRRELNALRRDLDALDKTLVLFGYDTPSDIKPVIAHKRLFKRNQLSRMIRDIELTETGEIAREVISRMGWTETPELYESVYKKVRYARWVCLKKQSTY